MLKRTLLLSAALLVLLVAGVFSFHGMGITRSGNVVDDSLLRDTMGAAIPRILPMFAVPFSLGLLAAHFDCLRIKRNIVACLVSIGLLAAIKLVLAPTIGAGGNRLESTILFGTFYSGNVPFWYHASGFLLWFHVGCLPALGIHFLRNRKQKQEWAGKGTIPSLCLSVLLIIAVLYLDGLAYSMRTLISRYYMPGKSIQEVSNFLNPNVVQHNVYLAIGIIMGSILLKINRSKLEKWPAFAALVLPAILYMLVLSFNGTLGSFAITIMSRTSLLIGVYLVFGITALIPQKKIRGQTKTRGKITRRLPRS